MDQTPPSQLPDPIAAARALALAHRHREALALLDRAGIQTTPARLARAEACFGLEQYRAAQELSRGVAQDPAAAVPERLRALVLGARLLLRASPLVDDALELALEAAREASRRSGDGHGELRELAGSARLELAHGLARKRCRGLASRELAAARELLGDDPRVLSAEAWLLLAFDERGAARERFAAALGTGDPCGRRLGGLGLALVDALAGDFTRAHGWLDQLGPMAPDDRELRRLRLRLLTAQARWPEVVTLLEDLLAGGRDSDTTPGDRHERAAALYHAGQRAAAASAWRELAAGGGNEPGAQRALRNARLIDRPEAATASGRRLAAFPSVAQLRNHCGPAAVELYLRFFGVPAEQIEVARAIKQPTGGTPIYRMRRYLESAGFTTRRLEAELPQLRRLLDAGLPVIMEEDYSESRHVAVAIGYDDLRQVLLVQDPLSHEVRETPYEHLTALRSMSNHGALVAVPHAEAERLSAAGAEECRTIALVDEAWAARDAGAPEAGDRLVDEALALRRDYELGWLYRFHRARELADAAGPGDSPARQALRDVVTRIVELWPDDEWPQQLLGEVLCADRRLPEALRAFERARDRDPADARNWVMIADCQLAAGREDLAHEALTQALRRDPGHRRANENQAWQYHRRGRATLAWLANEVARELAPGNPYNHSVHATLLAARGEVDQALAAWTRAVELAPERGAFQVERARLLARVGRLDEAVHGLTTAVAQRPADAGLRVDLAELLYRHGRPEAALAVCHELRALDPRSAAAHALAGAALCALGRLEDGVTAFRTALALRPNDAWALAELGQHLGRAGRHAEAVQACAAAAGLSGAASHALGLAGALQGCGLTAEAARRARAAAVAGPLVEDDWDRVAQLLAAGEGLHGAHQFLDQSGRKDPHHLGLARAHVRLLLERAWAPALAREPLQRLAALAPEDPFALTALGVALVDGAPAGHAEGERLLRTAIARAPALAAPRRLLAPRLTARGRAAEALAVLAGGPADFFAAEQKVAALLALDRVADAEAVASAFEATCPAGGPPPVGARMLRFRLASHRGDWPAALALAEAVSREFREREDDGRLDPWEEAKFECLVRMGERDRARRFGEQQAGDASSAARLARAALRADARELAQQFAARAHGLDPTDALTQAVRAALASG